MNAFIAFDLDDTLYKEVDYVKSAHNHIIKLFHNKYNISERECIKILQSSEKPFGILSDYINSIGGDETLSDIIEIYRTHFPKIALDKDVQESLTYFFNLNIPMGIITDGRQTTQMNKIMALHLDKFINTTNVIISESIGYDKRHANGFRLTMEQNQNCSRFYYIGDNTSKDFYWPNKLGWITICLKDNGQNIHQQNFEIESEYKPQYIIHNFSEIISLIKYGTK